MIGGEEYTVRSDLSPEYTREVAAFVDQALKKVLSQGPLVETHKAAILAALDITNELFQAKQTEREVSARLAAVADDQSQRLVLAAKEELMAVRENLHKSLDQKLAGVDQRDQELRKYEQQLQDRTRALGKREQDISARLEQVAGLTAQEAKAELISGLESAARDDAAALLRNITEQAKKNADREAKKIIALAIQRIAAEQTAESSVSAVVLPSDAMKGRIIVRQGRNIRAFEAATGVDVIIDDTPDTVVVSCFEPVRREIGRLALERLIADGRIHPGRIEEIVKKAKTDVDAGIVEAGEQAVYDTGIRGMHAELVKLVGRMKYRTSYGQNILEHSKEVAYLAGMMAAELKLDVNLAKRGALLHDVGKVLTHEHDGTHVQLGVEMATKYGENATVINCIAAHHDDVAHESPVSVIVQAADAISGSRPGARREAFETYVKRLGDLEKLASEFQGVEKVFAIQAGREVRVVVTPEAVDDAAAARMTDEIARKIERELQYPGQIKVVVIRETRAVGVAR